MAFLLGNRKVRKNIALILSLTLILLLGSFQPTAPDNYKVKTVVIDAGHGGKDPGTSGDYSREKEIALKVAKKVGHYIEKHLENVKVIYTRKDDEFVPLEERAEVANKNNADMFLSIHANAAPNENIHGTESYVMGRNSSERNLEVAKRENSVILLEDNYKEKYEGFDPKSPESHILFSLYQNAYQESSLKIAEKLQHQFKNRVGRKSRGVKQAGFWVLWKTSMPSVLIEIGFLSNPQEERYLNDELGQTYIASGIFRAFRDYKKNMEAMN